MSTELLSPPSSKHQPSADEADQSADQKQAIYQSFAPENLRWSNVDWTVLIWIAAMHVGALFAPFYFTWPAITVAAVWYCLGGSIGICLGFHRYLSHRSFKLKPVSEFFILLFGVLTGQGSPLTWTATHRVHHQRSDLSGDPHSPRDGSFWSHMMWLFVYRDRKQLDALQERYVPEFGGSTDDAILRTDIRPLAGGIGCGAVSDRRTADVVVGSVCSHGDELPWNLVCQFRHASLGIPQLRDDRRLT